MYFIVFITIALNTAGQGLDSLLLSVERNNPGLVALQKWMVAEEIKAKTGIYPENPEVDYYYLFGNSKTPGDQQEFEIMQPFRLPGYYTSKSDIQQLQFEQKEVVASKEKSALLHRVRTVYFRLVWLTKQEARLNERIHMSEKLLSLMNEGFENGQISKPVYDKARIYAMNLENDRNKIHADMEINWERLLQFNGGKSISEYDVAYPKNSELPPIEVLVEKLYDQNPELQLATLSISESEKQIRFQKMKSLPTFKAGYKYESIFDQELQGFRAGVTIPLWQNANGVKYAELQHDWSEANYQQTESEITMKIKLLYNETKSLYSRYMQMKDILEDEQVLENLFSLLDSGQISYVEYFVDTQYIWETTSTLLELENAYYSKLSELKMHVNY